MSRSTPSLTYGKLTQSGSQVFDDVIGHRVALSAPDTAGPAGGQALVFDSWSDGGDRSHDFVVPATPVELVAQYRAPQLDVAAPEVEAGAGMGGGRGTPGGCLSTAGAEPRRSRPVHAEVADAAGCAGPGPARRRWSSSRCAAAARAPAAPGGTSAAGASPPSSRSACQHPRFISASMRRTAGRLALARRARPLTARRQLRLRRAGARRRRQPAELRPPLRRSFELSRGSLNDLQSPARHIRPRTVRRFDDCPPAPHGVPWTP